jgi:tetratricopeptide (TPR) repeat protein
MRQLSILILIVSFFSCKTIVDKEKSINFYNQGINVLAQVDTTGKIDYLKALALFDESVRLNPESIESKYWKSQCEIHLGQLDKALKTSESVTKDLKNKSHTLLPSFYVTAGIVRKVNKNFDKANEYFKIAIEIYTLRIEKNYKDTDAIINKAIVLCYMDSKDEALAFINSIAVNDENRTMIGQIRENISTFDSEKLLTEINNRW